MNLRFHLDRRSLYPLLLPLLLALGGCQSPISPPVHVGQPPATSITESLARAGVRQMQIVATVPDNKPVVTLAQDTIHDLNTAALDFSILQVEWNGAALDAEKKLDEAEKKLASATSVADQRYRAFMRAVQAACALGAIGGFGLMLFAAGPLRSIAGAVAAACAVGFVGILVSVQIETFMDRYGLQIAAVALSLLLLIGLYALWAHVRANKRLVPLLPAEAAGTLTGVTARIVGRLA